MFAICNYSKPCISFQNWANRKKLWLESFWHEYINDIVHNEMLHILYDMIQKNILWRSLPKSSIFAHNYDNSKKNNFMIILCMLYVVLYLPSVDNRCLNFMNTSLYSKEEKKRILVLIRYFLLRISSFWLLPFKTDFSLRSFYWLIKMCQFFGKNLHKNLLPFYNDYILQYLLMSFPYKTSIKDNRRLIELPNLSE